MNCPRINHLAHYLAAVVITFSCAGAFGQEAVFDAPGADEFVVPEGVTEITVEVWGGGGRGGDRDGSSGGSGGGGGGGYARATIPVEEGEVYDYMVGAGSTTADPGEASTVTDPDGNLVVRGDGGQSVGDSVSQGSAGGDGSGDVVFPGGAGGNGISDGFLNLASQGGGGGSSAGPGTDGNDGQTPQGAAGPTGDGDSGDGGDGADGVGPGEDGQAPGGGGGGAARCVLFCDAEVGGAGGDGRVRITYDGPAPIAGLLMAYWFDEDWTDTDTIPDQSGEGRDGFSDGVAYAPAGADGARPGDPGTCSFAEIDGPDNVVAPVDQEVNDSDSFSAAFWMRMDESEQNDEAPSIMAVGELDGSAFFARRAEVLADFRGQDRDLVFFVRQGRTNNPRERTVRWETSAGDSNDPFGGDWVHIGVRHDMDSRLLEIYANGNLVASNDYGNQGPDGLVEANDDIQIGGFSGGTAPAELDFDEFRFYGEVLSGSEIGSLYSQERPCSTGLAGFEITLPVSASVCAAAPVTVAALDENGDVISDYSGDVNLSTSAGHGNWSLQDAQGSLNPDPHTADDGAAGYRFVDDDNGEAVFGLSNERADELIVTVGDSDAGISSTSDPIQYQENAFAIGITDSLGDDVVAGRDHAIELEALRRDPDTGECGRISAYDGAVGLKAWISRSPDDPGGAAPALSGSADTASMPDSEPGDSNIAVNFDNGRALLAWQTSDVGQHALNILDDSSGLVVDANDDPIPVSGSGAEWTIRPFGFDVSIAGNPAASGAGGDPFQAAGRLFDVTVRAVTWQSADDSNGDGQPDGHGDPDPSDRVDLSDNNTISAFGASDPSVDLSSTLVAGPTGSSDPGLADAEILDAFSGGDDVAQARFEEVGSIAVLADLGGSYLGRSTTVVGHSDYVGRFHPELFSVTESDGSFEAECNGFVYVGQDFGYDLAPELEIIPRGYVASGTGPLLNNYRDDWQRLEASDVIRDFPGEDDDNSLDVSVIEDGGALEGLGDGRMDYLFGADEYRYDKTQDSRVAPFDTALTIAITAINDGDAQLDSEQQPDGDDPLSVTPDPVEIRYGRLRLENAYGPETLPLILPMTAEYWTEDQAFRRNADESCWDYNTGDSVTLEPADFTTVNASDATLLEGVPEEGQELILDTPGEGSTGDVRATFDVPIWLQDDFNDDGELEDPSGLATFGVYRGHDRIIYWREVQ